MACLRCPLKALSHFTKFDAFAFGDPGHANETFHFTIVRVAEETDGLTRPLAAPTASASPGMRTPRIRSAIRASADMQYLQTFSQSRASPCYAPGGRLGFILPSGIYSDKGSGTLRSVLLDACRWEWCFGFENREGIFDIHRSFKFVALVVEKGGRTEAIHTAFMRRHVEDWARAETGALDYSRELVDELSPFSRALVEVRDPRDVAVLDRIYSQSVLLGDETPRGWGLRYGAEFHMTSDARLFPPLPKWEAQGYRPDEYGHWLRGPWRPVADFDLRISDLDEWRRCPHVRAASAPDRPDLLLSRDGTEALRIEDIDDVAVALYEGRMIGQFDFSQKGWVSGKGRTAVWRDIPWEGKQVEPQFLMGLNTFFDDKLERYLTAIAEAEDERAADRERQRLANVDAFMEWWAHCDPRTCFMDVSSATNTRGMISATLRDFPAGNKTPILHGSKPLELGTVLNSFAYDFTLRQRLGGLTLNYFIIEETPLPPTAVAGAAFASIAPGSPSPPRFSPATGTARMSRATGRGRSFGPSRNTSACVCAASPTHWSPTPSA